MADPIKVLIVDDISDTRDHLTKLLGFEDDIEVVGAAGSGGEALDLAARLSPDVVLMDINMPDMDGIAATEELSKRAPGAAVIMMSVQGEAEYLRRSMLAGAREFLVKPFSTDELTTSIRQVFVREHDKARAVVPRMAPPLPEPVVPAPADRNGTTPEGHEPHQPGRVVAVFGPKGGVGRTTIAVNLGIASKVALGRTTVLVDGSFQFGDVGVLLNLNPKNKSIADAVGVVDLGDPEKIDSYMIPHSSGLRVLLAPSSPEMAELVTPAALKQILARLKTQHDLVLIDCASSFNDATLAILDAADVILTVLTLELTSIKNIRLFLKVADQLGYSSDKIRLVLNRADSSIGIRIADVEQSIGRKVDHSIVSDGRTVVYALNRGVPFVVGNKKTQVSRDILRLASMILPEAEPATGGRRKPGARKSLFARR